MITEQILANMSKRALGAGVQEAPHASGLAVDGPIAGVLQGLGGGAFSAAGFVDRGCGRRQNAVSRVRVDKELNDACLFARCRCRSGRGDVLAC